MRQAHSDLTNTPEQTLQRKANLWSQVSAEKIDGERIKCVDVFIKSVSRKVGVALHDVDDHRPPGDDVPLLRVLVELYVPAYDVCTKTVWML